MLRFEISCFNAAVRYLLGGRANFCWHKVFNAFSEFPTVNHSRRERMQLKIFRGHCPSSLRRLRASNIRELLSSRWLRLRRPSSRRTRRNQLLSFMAYSREQVPRRVSGTSPRPSPPPLPISYSLRRDATLSNAVTDECGWCYKRVEPLPRKRRHQQHVDCCCPLTYAPPLPTTTHPLQITLTCSKLTGPTS